jgi:hypothetical protein
MNVSVRKPSYFMACLVALALMLGVTHCSDDRSPTPAAAPIPLTPSTSQMLIGPAGGTIVHDSGARLIVPTGALDRTTQLTLTGTQAPSAQVLGATPLGQAIQAGPEGQTFRRPVELILPFDPARLPPNADAALAQVRMAPRGSTDFVALDSKVDLTARTIRTTTIHFSQFVPAENPNPLFITAPTNAALPDGSVGVSYTHQFAVTGGASPYTWSLATGSVLPPGLAFSIDGSVTGTPTLANVFGFFVKVNDAAGHAVQKAYELTVLSPPNPTPVPVPTGTDAGAGVSIDAGAGLCAGPLNVDPPDSDHISGGTQYPAGALGCPATSAEVAPFRWTVTRFRRAS